MDTNRLRKCGKCGTTGLRTVVLSCVSAAALMAGAGNVYTNSASGNWSADASWTGSKPVAGGAADAAVVLSGSGAVASTNNLSGAFLLNRLEAVSGTFTLWGNTLSFTDPGAAGPQVVQAGGGSATFRTALSLGAHTTFAVDNGVLTVCPVSGTGGLVKTGAGELFCATNGNGALSYPGTTRIEGGTLTVATASGRYTMSSTNLTVLGGATLRTLMGLSVNGLTLPNSASVNVASGGTVNTDVPTISCGTFNAASGATVAGSSGCLSLHAVDAGSAAVSTLGSVTLKRIILEPYSVVNPTQTVRFDGTGPGLSIGTDSGTAFSLRTGASGSSGLFTFVMDIADSPAAAVDLLVPFINFRPSAASTGFAFVKRGAGLMQVNGLDWSSATAPTKPVDCSVEAGTLAWNTSAANAAGVNFASVTIAGGATFQVGAGGTAGALYVAVTDNGTLAFCRSNATLFTNAVSGTGRLVQRGGGTLTLTGTSAYSGGTDVESGTLLVNAPGALTGGGTVTAAGGTLGGNGTLGGPVVLAAGGTLLPGGSNTVGTLTLSDTGTSALTLSGGRLLCDLATVAGTCDRIDVAGTLVLNGTSRLALAFAAGTPPAGTYTLMTYASKSGSGALTLDRPYPNATLTVGATAATLTVTGYGITYLTWTGAVSGMWDITTANWLLEGVPSVYAEGDAVLFDDSASGTFTVGAAGAVSPSSVTFDNSVSNYVVSASLEGTETALIKMGSKSVTLSGGNTYGGGTILEGGSLSVGSTGNLPPGALAFRGGILKFTGASPSSLSAYSVNWDSFSGGLDLTSGTLTVADAVGGSGSLSKSGAGTLVLSGANSYRGGTTVNGGYLRVSHPDALGTGPVNMTSFDCELNLAGGLAFTNAITVRGDGLVNSAGSLQSSSGTSNTWNGPVTLGDGNARLGAPGGTLVIGGVIDSGTNVYDLVVRNPNTTGGTIVLAATNTWLGKLWIRCGTVRVGVPDAMPVASALHLGLEADQTDVSDSTFDLAGLDQEIAGLADRGGTENRHVVTCSAPTFATLTVNTPAASPSTFAGELSGNLDLVKAGSGTLTLAGASTTFGGATVTAGILTLGAAGTLGANCTNVVVQAGTLSLAGSAGIADNASLRIANGGGAKINLAGGVNEAVGYLYFDDKLRMGGTYGATGSGARTIDDEHFEGSGVLTVLHGNGGTVISLQ